MPEEITPLQIALLPLLGAGVAAMGTMVGLGGGFILVPILIALFPDAPPASLTTISLTVVFLNAFSATVSNTRARRIDVRTALLLVVGAIPAAVAGSAAAQRVSRDAFEMLFGILLVLGAVYVVWRGSKTTDVAQAQHDPNREIRERRGPTHRFYVDTLLATIVSPAAGFVSAFFGIGGGVVQVPALTFILRVPLRVASATALLVLVFTSSAALATRLLTGAADDGWRRAGLLGLGALFGAQVGVYLSSRVNARVVLMVLSGALVLVGLRQIALGLG